MFLDRSDAGGRLAGRLQHLIGAKPIVLALPRGGVPVAAVIASSMKAPLGLLLVRKIGAPGNPELAVGAVADGNEPQIIVNPEIAAACGVDKKYIDAQAAIQLEEIERRRKLYLGDRQNPSVRNRTVIVVDDGIATGATAKAALALLGKYGPRLIVLAVPVASEQALSDVSALADAVVCLETPVDFIAVGNHYRHFPQVSDDEVRMLLAGAAEHIGG